MQLVLSNSDYTFVASAKTITFAAPFNVLTTEQIYHIVNLSTGVVIYDADRRTHPISMAAGVITHTYDNTGMADADKLQISVDDGTSGGGGGGGVLNNFTATVAPTAADDSGDGYAVGSSWVDITADNAYVCLDATVDGAVWSRTTGAVVPEQTPVNAIASQGTITVTSEPFENDGFVIDTQTFLFKVSRTGVGEVTISSSTTTQRNNIRSAINADMTQVVATDGAGDTAVITAATKGTAANSYVFTETAAPAISVDGGGTLGGTVAGVDGTVGEANTLCADASYLYHCIATNTVADTNWRRISLVSF